MDESERERMKINCDDKEALSTLKPDQQIWAIDFIGYQIISAKKSDLQQVMSICYQIGYTRVWHEIFTTELSALEFMFSFWEDTLKQLKKLGKRYIGYTKPTIPESKKNIKILTARINQLRQKSA